MKPKVLILGGIYDFSCDLVCLRLKKSGTPFVRLNREHLKDYDISLNPIQPILNINGPCIEAEIGRDLTSIWFRQPIFLRNTPSHPLSPDEQLERSQWTAFMRALSVFDNAAWMNYPKATYLAECKPYQLLTAHRCGFKVPQTIIGNSLDAIKSNFKDAAVIKSLDTVLIKEGKDCLFTYTTLNDLTELSDQNLSSAPLLAQEALSPKVDLRVTNIGKKLFAVKILSQNKGIEGDWRIQPKDKLEYVDFQLEPETEKSVFKLTESLGLSYAAIDLAETPDGTYFIEVNPTGEWGWLSSKDRQIDLAIASWLIEPAP
jgi:glutathione synthase/RimK-type ligase-like ATP-grasp enzyme